MNSPRHSAAFLEERRLGGGRIRIAAHEVFPIFVGGGHYVPVTPAQVVRLQARALALADRLEALRVAPGDDEIRFRMLLRLWSPGGRSPPPDVVAVMLFLRLGYALDGSDAVRVHGSMSVDAYVEELGFTVTSGRLAGWLSVPARLGRHASLARTLIVGGAGHRAFDETAQRFIDEATRALGFAVNVTLPLARIVAILVREGTLTLAGMLLVAAAAGPVTVAAGVIAALQAGRLAGSLVWLGRALQALWTLVQRVASWALSVLDKLDTAATANEILDQALQVLRHLQVVPEALDYLEQTQAELDRVEGLLFDGVDLFLDDTELVLMDALGDPRASAGSAAQAH